LISLGLEEQREREPDNARQSAQMSLFQPEATPSSPDGDATAEALPHFLLDGETERRATLVRRTFFVSLFAHVAVIAVLVANPDLINLGSATEIVVLKPEEKQVTMLYEPPPPPRPRLQAPAFQPRPLPRSPGSNESELEKLTPGSAGEKLVEPPPPPRPQQPDPRELAQQRQREEQQRREEEARAREQQERQRQEDMFGIPKFPEIPRTPPRREPSFESIPRSSDAPREQAQLRLPELAPPSRGTDELLRQMARRRAEGEDGGSGGITVPNDPSNPQFTLPGPQILSDTMGVDFDPYLLRVYLIVRRNWYSVIPEIARLGRKGRVALQFVIRKNGGVTDLVLVDGSGTESMDAAAMSSIRLSNPFPDLPPDYPGAEVLLRFGYYYNMEPEYQR
jgi:TonB family protein